MLGHLYILQSQKTGSYYIGSCVDPDRRLIQHNSNAVASTKNKGPWLRVALISFASPAVAKKAEFFLKRQKSRRIIELVISGDFDGSPDFPMVGKTGKQIAVHGIIKWRRSYESANQPNPRCGSS